MSAVRDKSEKESFNYSNLVFPRKIILFFIISSFFAISFFVFIAFEINKWAVKRNETVFNEQQTLQVLLAKQALEENIYELHYDIEIIQLYFRSFLLGGYDKSFRKDALFQMLQTSRQEILSFIVSDSENNIVYSNLSVGEKGKNAKVIGESWIEKYWFYKDNRKTHSFTPPVYISPKLQLLGYLVPVWKDGVEKGVFCVVIDLAPMISRFVSPIGMGNYGTVRFLNQDGIIIFDDNVFDIGQRFSDIFLSTSGVEDSLVNNIINSAMGQGELFLPDRKGETKRFIAAWNSLSVGNEKLVLLLTATEQEVSSALTDFHLQINILGILMVAFVVAVNFILIYSRKKAVQNSARRLEALVKKRNDELALSETRYQAVFQSVNDALFIVEKNTIINFNKKALSMFGYSEKELLKLSPYDISALSREDSDGNMETLRSYVRKALSGTPQAFEWTQIRKDKSRFESELSLSAVVMESRKMLVSVVRDITRRKKNEKEIMNLNSDLENRVRQRTAELENANSALSDSLDELRKTQKSLVEAEKMASLGVLVAGIAHEINTPVGVGVTAASHLKEQTALILKRFTEGNMRKSELEEYIGIADESANVILENLDRASGHIKSFKNVAVDQASSEIRKFNLKEYISDIIISLNPVIKKTEHVISLEGDDFIEVETAAGAVSQIFTNLIMNSLKHGFEGIKKGSIVINLSKKKGFAVINYKDNGVGMEKDVLLKLFDPFFTTRRGSGGSGLGMHIVYNLVTQSLGGEIKCQSSLGKGTEILIKFPTWHKIGIE